MIGIVGAGVTGLALSRFLEERGVEHRVLEAAPAPGGVIRTTRLEGRLLEHGPQRVRLTPVLASLVTGVGLDEALVRVPAGLPLFVYRGGRLRRVPLTAGGFLRTDLLSPAGKLRFLLEPLAGGWREEEETVAAFFARKFGDEAYRALFGPLFGGIFAQDPADMYVRHSLRPLLRGLGVSRSVLARIVARSLAPDGSPPVVSFRDGMSALVEGLHGAVAARVRLETPVGGLRREGGGWTLAVPGGEPRVERVVLTVPADAAADLLEAEAPEASRRLRKLRYNDLAVVHLHGECSLEGLGYQVAEEEGLRTRGVTWNASALGRDGIYTAFLGGSRDPELARVADAAVGELARDELAGVTGCRARVLGVSRTRIPAWDRSWAALDDLALPPGVHLCANYESRVGIPGRVEAALALAEALASGR